MNKLFICLFCMGLLVSDASYYGSTTAPVTLAGGIIKAKHSQDSVSKYKRKDCPVCKGKGWYMSGDGILKIDCTYCEEDKGSITIGPIQSIKVYQQPNCTNGKCPPTQYRR